MAKAKRKRKRYTAAEKQEIIDFVKNHNKSEGRGGQTAASKKFKVSQLSIANWLKGGGASKKKASRKMRDLFNNPDGGGGASKKKASKKKTRSTESSSAKGSVASALKRMTVIQERIAALSVEYEALKKQI